MNFLKSNVLLKKINTLHESAESFNQQFSTLEKDLMLQYLRDLYECISNDPSEQSETAEMDRERPEDKISRNVEPPKEHETQRNPIQANGHHIEPIRISKKEEKLKDSKTAVVALDPEIIDLFASSQALEASNRFANIPLDDISKAMGINERILTINELFSGNQQLFQQVINKLNGMSSFEEAKHLLAHEVATKHNWLNKKKSKMAQIFINTVRRKYL